MRRFMMVAAMMLVQTGAYAASDAHVKAAKDLQKHAVAHSHEKIKPAARFSCEKTGGIAPVPKAYEIKLADLSKTDRRQLQDNIEASGLLNEKVKKETNPKAADVFFYHFVLINGKKTHDATFDDTTLPESYRPLLEFVKSRLIDSNRT